MDGELVGDENLTVYHETTYVSLPEFVLALQPDASVCWDGSQVVVQASGLTMTAKPGNCYIEANGRALHVPDGVLSLNSSTLVPIRTAAQAMGASVDWDQENSMISVHSGTGAITPAESYYDSDDLYWLSHIINAESGGEPLEAGRGDGDPESGVQSQIPEYHLWRGVCSEPVYAGQYRGYLPGAERGKRPGREALPGGSPGGRREPLFCESDPCAQQLGGPEPALCHHHRPPQFLCLKENRSHFGSGFFSRMIDKAWQLWYSKSRVWRAGGTRSVERCPSGLRSRS